MFNSKKKVARNLATFFTLLKAINYLALIPKSAINEVNLE